MDQQDFIVAFRENDTASRNMPVEITPVGQVFVFVNLGLKQA
jgi:hypothetical protein